MLKSNHRVSCETQGTNSKAEKKSRPPYKWAREVCAMPFKFIVAPLLQVGLDSLSQLSLISCKDTQRQSFVPSRSDDSRQGGLKEQAKEEVLPLTECVVLMSRQKSWAVKPVLQVVFI